jgi:hypothetical protein
MDYGGHFTRISSDECRQLVRARAVGRIAWADAAGVQVLPVSYTVNDGRIAFLTHPDSVMSTFLEPTEVAFEVDDVEEDTATGWSVVVRGRALGYLDAVPDGIQPPRPWAPGDNRLTVVIEPSGYTGRAVSADIPGGS